MSERITLCPRCKSKDVIVGKLHNPETHDLNCQATLSCEVCNHSWEGLTTSPWTESQRENGFLL